MPDLVGGFIGFKSARTRELRGNYFKLWKLLQQQCSILPH